MSNVENVRVIEPITAFGRMSVAEDTPKIQLSSIYGLPDTIESFAVLSGTVGTDEKGFFVSSGTTLGAFAVIRSLNSIIYKPGEGAILYISAIFSTGVANSTQRAGAFSVTDAAMFGYDNTDFGVFYKFGGALEIQTLTITTPAGGSENATITLDGTPYTVALTAGTVEHNAFEIATDLNVQAAGFWAFSQNDADVIAIAQLDEEKTGSFAFSSATAVAAWVETRNGVAGTESWVAQSGWDSQPNFPFDSTFRNVYRVKYQYLGYGDIEYSILIPGESRFQIVHTIKNTNTPGNLNFSNPSMNAGWLTSNVASTTDLVVSGGSVGYFVQGKKLILTDGRAAESIKSVGSSTELNLITIRNRQVFGDIQSKAELIPLLLSVSHENNKLLSVKITRNAILGGESNYQYVDKPNSIAEFDTAGTTVSGGQFLGGIQVGISGDSIPVPLEDFIKVALTPNETITVSGIFNSGAGNVVSVTITWLQDT